ncbi:ImmA/IrrE family metallo-endopeptidase [Amycolatopsis tolypomycina]|nr:ImmA/IrrE family metallo-endopeptidase [Amycolatopsis tolypomycina]
MTAKAREASLSSGVIAEEFYEWLESRYKTPDVQLPVIDPPADPEASAEHVRGAWSLGDTAPIVNMIHLLEAHGVAVFSLPPEYAEVDAFSFWRGSRPFVMLNTLKTAERSRFDAAHELGHLVMHGANGCGAGGRSLEKEANEFASAFLIPKAGLKQSTPKNLTTDRIISYKKKWKVSAMAMAYRLHQTGYLTDWIHRRMIVELGRLGFGKSEPEGISRESSLLLSKISESLRSRGSGIIHAARDLNIHPSDLNEIIFGIGVVSSNESEVSKSSSTGDDRKLRLIHSK